MQTTTPFHRGERVVQQQLGVHEQIEPWARQVVRSFLPEEHRFFYGNQPFLVAAARDQAQRPWVTLLAGEPGFVSTPDAKSLHIGAGLVQGDALEHSLQVGSDLGLLGIELATRRRNRVNGRISAASAAGMQVAVDQSFGNCPQYIQPREWVMAGGSREPSVHRAAALSADMVTWIESADTFFIGTGHREDGDQAFFGMDASHRGGEPGFVRVADAGTLSFPDYAGNNHFNTIGNLSLDPRVGLLFVDFARGSLLQLSGTATIDWDSPAVAEVPGARRLITVSIESVVEQCDVLPIRWRTNGLAIRSLRVNAIVPESEDVSSFTLEARDGGVLPDFEPGQHLPLSVAIEGQPARVSRTYSLSAAANGNSYRLSIKREDEGLVSRFLHDQLQAGDLLSAGMPAGDFYLKPGSRPVVMVSAGVGLTPLVSMLQTLVQGTDSRSAWFVHGARDGAHHPLSAEVQALAEDEPAVKVHVAYSQPRAVDVPGRDFHSSGRVDATLLEGLLPTLDADYYLCGPVNFMAGISRSLVERGVPPDQIHSETFGPMG